MQKSSTIQQKLMRLVLLISSVVLFLTCAGFFVYDFFTFRQASKERLSTLGEIISANSTAALAFQSSEDADEILNALKAEKHIVAACLYDAKGNIFAKYPVTLSESMLPKHPAKNGYAFTDSYLEGFQPVIQGGNRLGTLYLQSDIRAIYQRFERYGMIALLVIAASILVAYFLSKRLQRSISVPILALAETAGIISDRHDYTARAKKFDDDEVGVFTDAFNQMLAQIERQNEEIISFNRELELKVNERTNELEQANIELKLQSEFVETIINSSVDIIAVFDRNCNYVVLNKHGKEVYRLQDKTVIGKNILDIFPQTETSVMYSYLKQTLQKGKMIHDPFYRSYISNRIMENFFIPLFDKDGNVYNVLIIGHDITEISEAHEKLKLINKEIEKSNLDLEQFAFVASHDLQEPLRKIRTFTQVLQQKLDDKEAAKNYLAKIIASATRMSDLIKAILNYSRISNEKEQFEQVNLNEIIEYIKTDLELTLLEKEAVIQTDELPVIEGNPLQLNQLFLNLISNSIKFSKRKPRITISSTISNGTEVKEIDGFDGKSNYAELVFEDNGIGFEQQYANKIFTVFQRLHNKSEYPGTGIGLAVCKKIIDNHHGFISVKSIPGEGTTFNIYLPTRQ